MALEMWICMNLLRLVILLLLLGVDLIRHLHCRSDLPPGGALVHVVLHRPLDKALLHCHGADVVALTTVSLGHEAPHVICKLGVSFIFCACEPL